ncbi:hypothetical protein SAMN05216600_11915 [Pseudomonas cuatrocienegasensis]|uniref:VWFA domain-containing protein n=1 Tax=Pseudomonas cuatrocienegasensis TaxID=543360 RepID=A0ABY1BNB3_9PSED|nr:MULTISPECIES: hypothetical protein [Pseudomonas]OEC33668.1 hypothetical protein A7D25_17505 [Pseudomonas sp. 21C1]SER24630.1 hypothetical protein SAMN05216600_11915 [Pseudomonas cuatrocienegasensis]
MRRLLPLLVVGLLPMAAQAADERNDIPGCYPYAQLSQQQPAPSGRELVVIIDETVQMSQALQRSAWDHAMRYVRPGDSVRLYQFSAFLQNHYMKLQFAGLLDVPLQGKVRNSIGSKSLKQLDACLQQQAAFFQKTFGQQFVGSFGKPGEEIARSEIFGSLRKIAEDLASRPSQERVVLLVSDMLENSDFGSFYQSNRIRDIDPEAELKKVQQKNLLADFAGARVYVHGAGLVAGDSKGAYRSGSTLQRLEQFWRVYLQQSNADLAAFGAPELTADLR